MAGDKSLAAILSDEHAFFAVFDELVWELVITPKYRPKVIGDVRYAQATLGMYKSARAKLGTFFIKILIVDVQRYPLLDYV